jgi:sulfonate transport system substrate-binding protein
MNMNVPRRCELGERGSPMRDAWLDVIIFYTTVFGLLIAGCDRSPAGKAPPLRIGYQKWGTCSILKASGRLEVALKANGGRVEWIEFPAGPPLLEALNAGSIDFGHTGDSSPVFAQAAGVPLVYVGSSAPCPESSGIVVRADSPIQTLADLRGRKVAFTKGSSAHTMLLRALPSVGLNLDDIEPAYLSPADGRAALQAESVDAWSIWDPYLALAEQEGEARLLVSGEGFVHNRDFYLASASFLAERRDLVATLLAELNKTKRWAIQNPLDTATLLANQVGMEINAVQRAGRRAGRYDTETDNAAVAAEQQRLADDYYALGLLPHQIDVRSVFDFVTPAGE